MTALLHLAVVAAIVAVAVALDVMIIGRMRRRQGDGCE